MATTTLVTAQEFMKLTESDDQLMELIGGEIVTMESGQIPHEVVKKNLNKILVLWLAQNPIAELFPETMYRLDEYNSLMPDLGVLFPGRISPGSTGWIHGAPELAIEVVSPSETATRLEKKIELYLAHKCKSVWVMFPEQRVVRIFGGDGQSRKLEQGQTLEDATVLPLRPGLSHLRRHLN